MSSHQDVVCEICYDKHLKEDKLCINCGYNMCEFCNLKYILSRIELPHCVKCNHEFGRQKLIEMFGMAIVNTQIKLHIENVLYDSEKSKLPQFLIELNQKRM